MLPDVENVNVSGHRFFDKRKVNDEGRSTVTMTNRTFFTARVFTNNINKGAVAFWEQGTICPLRR